MRMTKEVLVVAAKDEVVVNASVKVERGHVCCRLTQINSLRHSDSRSYPKILPSTPTEMIYRFSKVWLIGVSRLVIDVSKTRLSKPLSIPR